MLPVDLELSGEPGYEGNLAELQSNTVDTVMGVAVETLAERNYQLGAMIDWNGDAAGRSTLDKDDLLATIGSLSRYGGRVAAHSARDGQLPVPSLPARLGTVTGSDATLYVGGWSYVAREPPHSNTADTVVAVLLVVAVIGILVALVKSSNHHDRASNGGHASGGHDGHHVRTGGTSSGSPRHTGTRAFGRSHHGARIDSDLVDVVGRTADIALAVPSWAGDPAVPRDGREPQMYLEMTLVDNRTGLALWHAHQIFPADAENQDDVTRAATTMLALLPSRAHPPAIAPQPPAPPPSPIVLPPSSHPDAATAGAP